MKLFSQTYPSDQLEGTSLNSEPRNSDLGSNEANMSPKPRCAPVVILPGLFGSTANWRGIAKKLGEAMPVIVLDQRNHGRSPHAESHSYFDMAHDLLEFIDDHQIDKIQLCGHSMGGKAAMVFSFLYPERLERLCVLDIAPVSYQHTHAPFIEAMIDLDLTTLSSRSDADMKLRGAIPDTATRLFLLQSLTGGPGNFEWRLNLSALLREMPKVLSFPSSELESSCYLGDTLFVGGALSDYIQDEQHSLINKYFSKARFETVSQAGHWLHAEQPKAVLAVLLNFLEKN